MVESRPGVRIALRTNSMIALLTATADGAGISVLSGTIGERELALVRLFDVPALPPRALYLVMHPDAGTRAAVRVVADQIARVLAAPPAAPK